MGRSRTYPVNEHFFDEICTEAQAYWLGFLTADGYVTDRHVRVRLQGGDKDHLEKFAKALASEHLIFEGVDRGRQYAELVIGSRYMVSALAKLGLTRNKSLTIEQSQQVPLLLFHHYWRGVFDGDGTLASYTFTGRKSERWSLGLVGNKYIVPSFAAFVYQRLGIEGVFRVVGNTHSVTYNGITSPQKISSLLYKDASTYLERKHDQFQFLSTRKLLRKNYEHVTKDEVAQLYEIHRSWNKVATQLGMSRSALLARKDKWGL